MAGGEFNNSLEQTRPYIATRPCLNNVYVTLSLHCRVIRTKQSLFIKSSPLTSLHNTSPPLKMCFLRIKLCPHPLFLHVIAEFILTEGKPPIFFFFLIIVEVHCIFAAIPPAQQLVCCHSNCEGAQSSAACLCSGCHS